MVLNVTDANFEDEVLNSDLPVLVDFWAEWCGPCRMLTPVIEKLASEYDGKLKVVKLDTDSNNATAVKYGITGIPCVIVFKGGQEVNRLVGFRPKDAFDAELKNII